MEPVEPRSRGIQIGIDIGQQVDPTAIVVVERQLRDYTWEFDFRGSRGHEPIGGAIHYVVRHIERMPLKTPYPKVADRLAEIYDQLAPRQVEPPSGYRGEAAAFRQKFFASSGPKWHDTSIRDVLVDATGVGKPVVDLIEEKGVRCTAVYLTGGNAITTEHGKMNVAKGLLVSHLQVLVQSHLILLPPNQPDAQAAIDELLKYEIKVTDAHNLQMGVFKTGAHDDLATALALACWEKPQSTITWGVAPPDVADLLMGGGGSWNI